jgi:hypothetical protein
MKRDDDWILLLIDSERRRVNALLGVVFLVAAFVWLELGRRLGFSGRVADERATVVNTRLDTLTSDQLGHEGRSQGVSSVFKAAATLLSTFAVLIAIFVPLIATHTI